MNYPTPVLLLKKSLGLTIFLACFMLSSIHGQYDPAKDYYPPSPVPDRIMLSFEGDPAHSQSVSWRTDVTVTKAFGQIMVASSSPDIVGELKEVEAATTLLQSDKNTAHYHALNFTGLSPNTQYAYRVGDKTLWSEWFHFTTASDGEKAFSFLYFGDAQNDLKSRWSRTIRGAYSKMPNANFLLHAGDLINQANKDHEWGEWFYAGGWIFGTMPSVATPGNHEYARTSAGGERILSIHWRPTFALPQNGPEGLEETAYYLDYQNTRIISINSQAFLSSEKDRKAQVTWLEQILTENRQKWTIVTMHHPVHSSAKGRDNKELQEFLQPLFEQHHVDLVLQGHDHTYGRGGNIPIGQRRAVMNGPVYVVSVSGPKMYTNAMEDWMQRAASNTQLYQLIKIDKQTLTFEAYTVTGELYDAFDLVKRSSGKTIFRERADDAIPERLDLPPSYEERLSKEEMDAFKKQFEAYKKRRAD